MPITAKCSICGKKIARPPSRMRAKQPVCSLKCNGLRRMGVRRRELMQKGPRSREAFEYLLGAVCGDGSLDGGKWPREVFIACADEKYGAALKEAIRETFEYEAGRRLKAGSFKGLSICSVAVRRMFEGLKHDYKWSVPQLQFPAEFVAGVVDTDGCVILKQNSVGGEVSVTQKLRGNLVLLQGMLKKLGVRTTICHGGRGGYPGSGESWRLRISCGKSKKARASYEENMRRFAKLVKLRHPDKAARLAQLISSFSNRDGLPQRRRVIAVVRGLGRATVKEIAEATGVTWGAAKLHVKKLRECGALIDAGRLWKSRFYKCHKQILR
jgi:DNA-binding transcriptional ArsR family regulator